MGANRTRPARGFVTKNVTKVGRPRLKKRALTDAQRQRRHRDKVAGLSRAEATDELHETPAIAVHKLMKAETLPQHIWDPCCGPGAIIRIVRASGRSVTASDLRDYDDIGHVEKILRDVGAKPDGLAAALRNYVRPRQDFIGDFLETTAAPPGVEAMVMNPPFSKAAAFIRHALTLVPLVIVLVRLAWLESTRQRKDLTEGGHLARVHVFRERLPRMHRFGWPGPRASATEGHCWLVFEARHGGPPALHWL